MSVLLEDVRAQQYVMLEAITSLKEHFDRKLEERLAPIELRLTLEEARLTAGRGGPPELTRHPKKLRGHQEEFRGHQAPVCGAARRSRRAASAPR